MFKIRYTQPEEDARGRGGEEESRIIVLEGQLSPSMPVRSNTMRDLFVFHSCPQINQ